MDKNSGLRRKGRSFYILLAILSVFIIAIIAVALVICFRVLDDASEQAQTSMATVLELQMQSMDESYSGVTDEAVGNDLIGNKTLEELSDRDVMTCDDSFLEAETLLRGLYADIPNDDTALRCFYFSRSGYLMSCVNSERSEHYDVELSMVHDVLETLDPKTPGTFQKWLLTDSEGNYYSVNVKTISDTCFCIRVRAGKPSYSLPDAFTSNLVGVEMYVYDQHGNVHALEGENTLIDTFDYNSLGDSSSDTFFFEHGGHSYIGAYCTFTARQTRLAVFFRDTAAESKQLVSHLLIIAGIALIAVCLALAVLFARRAYKPLSSVLSKLPDDAQPSGPMRDEYSLISKTLDSWDSTIKRQGRLLQDSWLQSVLHGSDTEKFAAYQDDWLISQDGQSFAVVALRVDDTGIEGADSDLLTNDRLRKLVSADLEDAGFRFRDVEDADFILFVVKLSNRSTKELAKRLTRLQTGLGNGGFSAYISSSHMSVRELHRCYDEAVLTATYCMTLEKYGMVLGYESVEDVMSGQTSTALDFKQLQSLSDCISTLALADALVQYDRIVYQLSDQMGHLPASGDMTFSLLVNTVALSFYDIVLPGDISKESIQLSATKVRECKDTTELRGLLETALREFHRQSDSQNNDRERFERIRDYIKESFRDPNLSSKVIADRFGTSQSNISRMFKKYNGTGFLEYVHKLRVTEAIKLLRETDMTEAEIAPMVGYNNVITMIRAFKSYASTTPSAIRSMRG